MYVCMYICMYVCMYVLACECCVGGGSYQIACVLVHCSRKSLGKIQSQHYKLHVRIPDTRVKGIGNYIPVAVCLSFSFLID